MNIDILVSMINNFGKKGYYNSQEVGLAKCLAKKGHSVHIYKLLNQNEPLPENETNGKFAISYYHTKNLGINGLVDTRILNPDVDALVYFADTQLSVPKIYQWCKKNNVAFIPYIGVIESHSTNKAIRFVMNSLFRRNVAVYKKVTCLVKNEDVKNTACPTMWGLTPDKMQRIPQKKADGVVTTLTNYMKSEELDKFMLDCLISNYRKVYVWLQAIEDYSQLDRLGFLNKVQIIPSSIKEYEKVLSLDVDYIGTRLHGGIHALNYGKRSLIVSVDNRAIEIKKDTNLPVISRESVKEELDEMINEPRITEIHLPQNNINIWKQQFVVCGGGTAL